MKQVARIVGLLKKEIWETRPTDLPRIRALSARSLRTALLAFRSFRRNDTARTASVLTYYSILNFIPLLAVVFAVAKGFGLRRVIQGYVLQMADAAHFGPEMANQVILFSNSLLKQARGGIIAGIGTVLLLWTVISILGRIEDSFNSIWEVKQPRALIRKFSDYMSILVVAPILFAISTSATVVITGQRLVDILRGLESTTDPREVLLLHPPVLNRTLILACRSPVLRHQNNPARLAIQPAHQMQVFHPKVFFCRTDQTRKWPRL